ncbi:MAG: UbiA family prenyltransferase, partial [Gammaproteobacteria bacterium]
WAGAYDTMYAMVDRDDDRKIGVRSTAILFGRYDRFIIAFLQIDVLVLLWLVGRMEGLGVYYQIGLAAAAGFAIYQHWLINGRDTVRCFRAFMNNAWFGAAVFFGIWLDYTLV